MLVFVLFFVGIAALLAVTMAFPRRQWGLVATISFLVLALASNSILGLLLLAEGEGSRTLGLWLSSLMVFLVPNVLAASAIWILSRRSLSVVLVSIITFVTATIGLAVGILLMMITECSQHSCM